MTVSNCFQRWWTGSKPAPTVVTLSMLRLSWFTLVTHLARFCGVPWSVWIPIETRQGPLASEISPMSLSRSRSKSLMRSREGGSSELMSNRRGP